MQRSDLSTKGQSQGLYCLTEPLPAHLLKQILYEETAERIHALGKISDAEGSLVRTFFSPAHIRAASQVQCDI